MQNRRFTLVVRSWSLLLILVSFALPLLMYWFDGLSFLYDSWFEYLAVLAFVGIMVSFLFCGRPASTGDWCEFMGWQLSVTAMGYLYVVGGIYDAIAWTLMIALRAVVAGAWSFLIIGLPVAVNEIRRLRRSSGAAGSLIPKLWFSCALTFCLAESICRAIERFRPEAVVQKAEFPKELQEAPADEYHIAAIGGSTTLGWPYHPHASIVQVAALRLQSLRPEAAASGEYSLPRIVVHNLARSGDGIVLDIEQLNRLPFRPHVLLIYTGHNEIYHETSELLVDPNRGIPIIDRWLEYSALFREIDCALASQFSALWRIRERGRRLFDHVLVSDQLKAARLDRFRTRLEQLSQFCRRERIETLWFVPAASESGYPPDRSVLRRGTGAGEREELELLYNHGLELEARREWLTAAAAFGTAVKLQPEFAEFHFRLASCLLQAGQSEAAGPHFQQALELDQHPVRAQSAYRDAIRRIALAGNSAVIDAAAVLRPHTSGQILDESMFLDDVHPTLKATCLLGEAAAEQILTLLNSLHATSFQMQAMDSADVVRRLGVTPERLAKSYETLAEVQINRNVLRFEASQITKRQSIWRKAAEQLRDGTASVTHNPVEQVE